MNLRIAGAGLLVCAVVLISFFEGAFEWAAGLVLALFNIAHGADRILTVSAKLRTLSWLIPAGVLIFSFRRGIKGKVRNLFSHDGTLLTALGLSFLAMPGVVFYLAGIQVFRIKSYPLILSGLFATLLVEFFLITGLLWVASRMSRFNTPVAVVLVSFYAALVVALAALVSVSGETDYIKYSEMILEANYGYLLSWKMLFFYALGVLSISLVVMRLQKLVWRGPGVRGLALPLTGAGLLILVFQPITLVGDILALPSNGRQSFQIRREARDVSSLVGGHLPHLLKESIGGKDFPTYKDLPRDLKDANVQFGLLPNPAPVHPDGDLQPFKRIVLLTLESFSLDFTGFDEAPCSSTITPRIDSLMAAYPSGGLWTNSSPTLYGLTSIFSSHPNARVVMEKEYANSFVKLLGDQGFRTVFIRSASEEFANEHVYFRQAGFQEILGRDFFRSKKNWSAHISEWGLEDAWLYRYAVEFLKENSDERLFVHLLPADTHGPYGRGSYSSEYPGFPEGITCEIDNPRYLGSFYRQDFDVGRFYDDLMRENLIDDGTLFIITADHSSPRWYNPKPEALEKVPAIFMTGRGIPGLDLNQPDISQIDLAPTILELAGIQPPWGYFGRSLIGPVDRSYLGIHAGELTVRTNDLVSRIRMDRPEDQTEDALVRLTNGFYSAGE